MAEIDVDYGQVRAVAGRLTSEGSEIQSTLTLLQSRVTELLTSSGGLWMTQSSPVMSAQYAEFNASLTAAIQNIGKFAESFNMISQNLQTMDASLAKPSGSDA
ncbi:WXG100 family type VII secretion target [Frankia sp. AgB32]|uniref:WXG100 family type VII secretion target n=1 Tax=Frankia sp. AgB32 TaxID=631119 RepID=UPI00201051DA|nr:WXG100 family type VII secretion target [Frankia sp. AgB32]MCK9894403.1 WXG100 family type VII secretion target [Frankia sp. AgB32]